MISRFFRLIAAQLTFASIFSMCLAPVNEASAGYNDCCEPCEKPCGSSFLSGNAACWIGGAALGAAAGAATGAAVSNNKKGKHGERGPIGPTGATGATGATGPIGPIGPTGPAFTFPTDGDNTLTFHYTLDVTAAVTGSSVTFYVTKPDGTVIETATHTITAAGLITDEIIITPPEFGSYTVGAQVTSVGVTAVVATLLETVDATRDASVTTILNVVPAIAIIAAQAQTSADFVYGAPPVP